MPPPSFHDRLASIAAKNGCPPPLAAHGAFVADQGRRRGSHKERVERALALAEARGLARRKLMPPAYWGLIRLGLPIRPIHFMGRLGQFLAGFLPLPLIFGTLLAFDLFESSERSLFRLIHWLDWPGLLGLGLVMGVLNIVFTRRQARRHDLPSWHEI